MKAQLGDYIWLYGRRRAIVRIEGCKHGGHCYYGVRMKRHVATQLAKEHDLWNIGGELLHYDTWVYWIRSDRLTLFDGQALRTGKAGRPKLEYRLGRKCS